MDNLYFRVETNAAEGVVRLVRSSEAMPDEIEVVRRIFGEMVLELGRLSEEKLLIDLREGPGRNDEAFERATDEARRELQKSFPRVAVLVRSAAGKLQLQRLHHGTHNVFLEETAALRFLSSSPVHV
jgi:hypothetical protein